MRPLKSDGMALHIPTRLRSGDARSTSPMPGRLKEFASSAEIVG